MYRTVFALLVFFVLLGPGSDLAQAESRDSFRQLRQIARAHYTVEEKREGDQAWLDWVSSYTPPGTQDVYDWRLQANIVSKPGHSDLARLWFNCGQMPKNPNSDRMAKMLEWNGSHPTSGAYFKIGPGSQGVQLSIVVDMPMSDVIEDKFVKVVDHMLQFAYDTMSIWAAPGDPLATATRPVPSIQDLVGNWSGNVMDEDQKIGEWSVRIEEDGFVVLSRVNLQAAMPTVKMATGTARIEGNDLWIRFAGNSNQEEVYGLKHEENSLTLFDVVSKAVQLRIELKRST